MRPVLGPPNADGWFERNFHPIHVQSFFRAGLDAMLVAFAKFWFGENEEFINNFKRIPSASFEANRATGACSFIENGQPFQNHTN